MYYVTNYKPSNQALRARIVIVMGTHRERQRDDGVERSFN